MSKKEKDSSPASVVGIILCVITAIIGGVMDLSNIATIILSLIALVLPYIVILIICAISNKINEANTAKSANCERFYLICKKSGLSFPLNSYEISKCKKLAEENNIPVFKCKKIFNQGYYEHLEKLRAEEENIKIQTKEKLALPGASKYVQGLTNTFESDYKKYLSFYDKTTNLMEQKTNTSAIKHDPYTWGGIASGIAGTAAGIVTAIQTENENAMAELQAKATRKKAYQGLMHSKDINQNVKKEAEKVIGALNNLENNFENKNKIKIKIDYFNVEKYFARETGTLCLTITVKDQHFYSDKNITGIAYAKIFKNNTLVGIGYIYTPGYLEIFNEEKAAPYINSIRLNKFKSLNIICFPKKGYMFCSQDKYEFEFGSVDTWEFDLEQFKKDYHELCVIYNNYKMEKDRTMKELFIDSVC